MSEMKLESVFKACQSKGGIRSIIFFVDNGFLQLPSAGTGIYVTDPVTFVDMPAVFTITYRKSTAILRERKSTDNRAGDYYDTELIFSVPKNRVELRKITDRLRNRRVHAITTDRNGFRLLLLNLRNRTDYDSGDRIGTPNRYTFRFSVTSEDINPAYLSDFIDVPDDGCEGGLIQLDGAQLIDLDGDCLIQLNE